MHNTFPSTGRSLPNCRSRRSAGWLFAAIAFCALSSGCAALTNPVADGLPVRRLPPELLGETKSGKKTIPLTLLGQAPPSEYRLAPGDVLGIYIEGILPATTPAQTTPPTPPVYFPAQISALGRRLPPAVGYPFPVRDNGTLALPLVDPVRVNGMTIAEADRAIREAYTVTRKLIQPGRERIIVTLMQQRQYRVTVIRQESGGFTSGGVGGIIASSTKRGTGHLLDLPAYENDVLSALAQTGGLPGLDALNEIIIFKGGRSNAALLQGLESLPTGCKPESLAGPGQRIVEIPVRLRPDEPPPFRPEDVVLETGDVVFIETRDFQVFYTGGLLPAGEFLLPLDYDLDVVKAVSLVKGSLINGAFGGSNLSGTLIAPGIGNPSPSLLTVLRCVPGGKGQVAIRVDLNRALRDPRERVLVQPGDILILQENSEEALSRYFTQTVFNFSLAWQVIHERFATGVIDISAPNQIPGRIGVSSTNTFTP